MPDLTPVEVVLDYEADEIRFDGKVLPFPLSAVQTKAKVGRQGADVTITLGVDQLRTVAPIPKKPEPTPEPPTPEEVFEQRLARIRGDHV